MRRISTHTPQLGVGEAGLLGCEGGRLDGCCGSWSDMAFEDFGFSPECELPSYLAFFRLQTIFRDIRRNTVGFQIQLTERTIAGYTADDAVLRDRAGLYDGGQWQSWQFFACPMGVLASRD